MQNLQGLEDTFVTARSKRAATTEEMLPSSETVMCLSKRVFPFRLRLEQSVHAGAH